MDSDLVVSVNESDVSELLVRLQDVVSMSINKWQLRRPGARGSFNLIHLETMFKVDIFIAKDDEFDRAQIERRVARDVAENDDRKIYVLSAEDTTLAKLRWYRMGGEQSERQWRDVIGVMKVQAEVRAAADNQAKNTARERHSIIYYHKIADWAEAFKGPEQIEALRDMEAAGLKSLLE